MVKTIYPVSIGSRVPSAGFDAEVHSVFHTAANLSIEGLNHLLTLFVAESMDLPQGIRLPDEQGIGYLKPGQSMVCREGILWSTGYPYKFILSNARKYDGRISALNKTRPAGMERAFHAAWDVLAQRQNEKQADLRIDALLHPVDRKAPEHPVHQALRELVLVARQFGGDLGIVRDLIGLGGGLTPTGDDVLVGFLAGLQATAGNDSTRLDWVRRLCEQVDSDSQGTNDISRSYLVLAADGQFSSSLIDLATVICNGEPQVKVLEVAGFTFEVGHTSGMDAATGLLLGLGIWQDVLY